MALSCFSPLTRSFLRLWKGSKNVICCVIAGVCLSSQRGCGILLAGKAVKCGSA